MADLASGGYPNVAGEYALQAFTPADVSRVVRQTMSRTQIIADNATPFASGAMLSVSIPLMAGDIVTKISFRSGATAAATPTHYFFALYDPLGNFIAQTADQTSTAWAADTTIDLALTTPYQVGATSGVAPTYYAGPGAYRVAISMAAGTIPSLVGVTLARSSVSTSIYSTDKPLAQTSGSGITATAPATIATPTASVVYPWVGVH